MLASAFSVAYSLRFIHGAFAGPDPVDLPRKPHEPPTWMRFPVEILVLICIMVGILPAATVGPFLDLAVRSVLGEATPPYSLAVWHGFNLPLLMSVVALAGGVVLYLLLQRRLSSGPEGPPLLRHLEGQRIFERTMVFLSWRLARRLEGARRHAPAAAAASVDRRRRDPGGRRRGVAARRRAGEPAGLARWIPSWRCCGWWAAPARSARPGRPSIHRLAALILVGGAGLVVCVTFVWFSAPDLALTQLTVEVVTTVLLLLGLRWLPKRVPAPRGARAGGADPHAASARPRPRGRSPAAAWRRCPTR